MPRNVTKLNQLSDEHLTRRLSRTVCPSGGPGACVQLGLKSSYLLPDRSPHEPMQHSSPKLVLHSDSHRDNHRPYADATPVSDGMKENVDRLAGGREE